MLFINTRPLDESIAYVERRPSKANSHASHHSQQSGNVNMARLVLCLLLFYLLASIFPVLFYFPIALVSLIVPVIVLLYALCRLREDQRSDHWPCIMIATSGILLKIAAIIIYIIIFPSNNQEKRVASSNSGRSNGGRQDGPPPQYRAAFFVLVVCTEVFILLIGVCLKWHLVAFEKMENEAKMRRLTMTSSRPLLSESTSRRISRDPS